MGLDIRWPIGLMFGVVGALMLVYGLVTGSTDIYQRSLNINVNLYWGLILVVFGALMLLMAWKGSQNEKTQKGNSGSSTP